MILKLKRHKGEACSSLSLHLLIFILTLVHLTQEPCQPGDKPQSARLQQTSTAKYCDDWMTIGICVEKVGFGEQGTGGARNLRLRGVASPAADRAPDLASLEAHLGIAFRGRTDRG